MHRRVGASTNYERERQLGGVRPFRRVKLRPSGCTTGALQGILLRSKQAESMPEERQRGEVSFLGAHCEEGTPTGSQNRWIRERTLTAQPAQKRRRHPLETSAFLVPLRIVFSRTSVPLTRPPRSSSRQLLRALSILPSSVPFPTASESTSRPLRLGRVWRSHRLSHRR
jgi:hypothetical protein